MRQLRITLAASKDLQSISDYFLEQSIQAGDRFVEIFGQKCKYLVQFPYIGKTYDYLRPNLRGLSVMGYIVFYQVTDDSIDIIRVVSGYRNVEDIFSEP